LERRAICDIPPAQNRDGSNQVFLTRRLRARDRFAVRNVGLVAIGSELLEV
jgi:hypothetical protein